MSAQTYPCPLADKHKGGSSTDTTCRAGDHNCRVVGKSGVINLPCQNHSGHSADKENASDLLENTTVSISFLLTICVIPASRGHYRLAEHGTSQNFRI